MSKPHDVETWWPSLGRTNGRCWCCPRSTQTRQNRFKPGVLKFSVHKCTFKLVHWYAVHVIVCVFVCVCVCGVRLWVSECVWVCECLCVCACVCVWVCMYVCVCDTKHYYKLTMNMCGLQSGFTANNIYVCVLTKIKCAFGLYCADVEDLYASLQLLWTTINTC